MKLSLAGLLAGALLLGTQSYLLAQTSTTSPATTANPRANPDNDQSGPRASESRTDASPNASTPAAEQPAMMNTPGSSMSDPSTISTPSGTSMISPTKPMKKTDKQTTYQPK